MPHPNYGARWFGASAALAVCLVPVIAAEQRTQAPASPQVTFRSGVELVQIDVVVTDERGNHVRGLTAGDFTIFDRGKPQPIAAFEEISRARESGPSRAPMLPPTVRLDVASNQSPRADRLVVLVIDDLHIWRGRTELSKGIARRVLEELGADATMAVVFTSGDRSVEPTSDRAVLFDAVASMKGRQSVRRPNQAVDKQGTDPIDPEAPMEVALGIVQAAQDTSLQQFVDNMSTIAALEEAARLLGAGEARRKAFVFLSEGMAKNPTGIFETMAVPGEPPEGGAEYASTGDAAATIRERPERYHDIALVDMMEAMQRANVTTYAIDPRGEVTSQELALESFPGPPGQDSDPIFRWDSPVRIAQDGLATIAEASGGFAVVNTDDFASGLARIVSDLDHYYLLGFYPADTEDEDYRPIRVRVAGHPEWTLRFRRGYETSDPPDPSKDSSPLVALSAGILPETDLALALTAVPLAVGAGRETRVALAIEVTAPRMALQEGDGRLRDELTYEVLVVDAKKKKVETAGGLSARVTLSPAVASDRLPESATYQLADTITLAPGRYQLRVSAQSAKLAKGGSVYLDIDVPDFSRQAVAIGGIALGYAGGARVATATAAPRPMSPAQRAARMVIVPPAPALPFAPTLDRAFAADDRLRIYFEVSARDNAAIAVGLLEIVNAGDAAVRSSIAFTPDDRGRVDLTLPLANLTPGAYIMRATYTASEVTSREVGFVIR